MALLVAAAATASAVVAYAAAENRFQSQVDAGVQQAAQQLAVPNPAPGNQGHITPATPSNSAVGTTATNGVNAPPHGPPPDNQPPPPGPLFNIVIVQYLTQRGTVASHTGPRLGVSAHDRLVAAHETAPWLRTETVDHMPYRVITTPVLAGGAVEVGENLSQNDDALHSLGWLFAGLAALVTLLAAMAGWLIARRITKPLESLTTAAEDIASGGDLDRSLPTGRRDEVGRLGRAFSAMLGSLNQSRHQQHQLVRDAGHELRTPITSLRSNVDVLRRYGTDLPVATMDKLLTDLDAELRELTGLVDEVIEVATERRSDEPKVHVALDALVERVAERAADRSGRVVLVNAEPWVICGQPQALERAVANLVENGLKFSSESSTVEIRVQPGRIAVSDDGAGIPPEDLDRIFERFYRSPTARSQPGSGLGLAIVRQVAQAHGGHPFAKNLDGGGCTVGMDLPLD